MAAGACVIAASLLAGAQPAAAQSSDQKPAVDGFNGKASFQGGRLDGDDAYFGAGR